MFYPKRKTKLEKFTAWSQLHKIKSSSLIFGAIMVIGGGWLGVDAIINNFKPEAATVANGANYADEIPGWWYSEYFGASVCEKPECEKDADPDGDKLTNFQEYYYSVSPIQADTNNNGLTDGEDVAFGYAPNKPGKVSFDDALSDDSIVGESLLFNDEIKDVVTGMSDLSKVPLPEVNELELNIIPGGNVDDFTAYMSKVDEITKKFYPDGSMEGLSDAVKQQNPVVIQNLKLAAAVLVDELKKIPVPADAVQLHQYQIAIWKIIPVVVEIPSMGAPGIETLFDAGVNKWYDSVQTMIALNQKVQIELLKLRNQYEGQLQ
jgi:hypothetical protein